MPLKVNNNFLDLKRIQTHTENTKDKKTLTNNKEALS